MDKKKTEMVVKFPVLNPEFAEELAKVSQNVMDDQVFDIMHNMAFNSMTENLNTIPIKSFLMIGMWIRLLQNGMIDTHEFSRLIRNHYTFS